MQPAWVGTEAEKPVWDVVTVTGAVTTGLVGAATTFRVEVAGVEAVPAELDTMQDRFMDPVELEAVKVTVLVVVPAVRLPPVIVQA